MNIHLETLLDSIFKRDDIRGLYPEELNDSIISGIGQAMAERLICLGFANPRIAVGHDARLSSPSFSVAFCRGVVAGGGYAESLGLVSTEHVYYVCGQHTDTFAGGAMITASHNPASYNGVKMAHAGAAPFNAADLAWLKQRLLALLEPVAEYDCKEEFAEHLVKLSGFADWPSSSDGAPFTVVVAAGNGVGGVAFAPIASRLAPLGLREIGLDLEPDGNFPHGVANPLLPEYMERLGQVVRDNDADLGIGFDGDADRAGFTDSDGKVIDASHVIALVTKVKAKQRQQSNKADQPMLLMRNLCSSQLLFDLHPEGGPIKLLDTPVGHGKVKLLMRHPSLQKQVIFAGEHSGHFFHPEFHFVDSGMLTSLNLLMLAWELKRQGSNISAELANWRQQYRHSGELNFVLSGAEQIFPVMRQVWQSNQSQVVERHEVRLDPDLLLERVFVAQPQEEYCPDKLAAPDLKMLYGNQKEGCCFVLRPSGNEPKLRLNVEAWGNNATENCQKKTRELTEELLRCGAKPG